MLRRLQAGQFQLTDAHTIEQLTAMTAEELNTCLMAVDEPLQTIPAVQLSSDQAIAIQYGQTISFDSSHLGSVRIYHNGLFLGLGEMALNGKLAPKKLFNLTD